jgi:hypothetical protein
MAETPNMGLVTWGPNDYFNDADLKANWEAVDAHDHTGIGGSGGTQIPTDGLQNNAITTAKIGDDQVTGAKLRDASVDQAKLTSELQSALTIAGNALASTTNFGAGVGSQVSGSYDILSIKSGAVADDNISVNAAIDPSKINIKNLSGSNLSRTTKLLDSTSSAAGAITGTFSSLAIGAGKVGETELAINSVIEAKIKDGAVTAAKLAAGAIPSQIVTTRGIYTDRPSAASAGAGKQFWAYDTASLYYSDGSNWHAVTTSPGTISAFGRTTAPDGWVPCDGATYSAYASRYTALFSFIGYEFGGTPTAAEFKVPNAGPGDHFVQYGSGYPWGAGRLSYDPKSSAFSSSSQYTTHYKHPTRFIIKL